MASGRGRTEWEVAADAAGYEEFDPLNRVNLGRSLETALQSQPLTPLSAVPPFWGSGIYALYFSGSAAHPLYGRLANSHSPLYVGRAVPRGARKGLAEAEDGRRSRSLWARLDDHRGSIRQARNLDVDDLSYRRLVADMLFVPMAEGLMIQTYRPLWNTLIDGFGNHAPGSGRPDQKRSSWDELHPGRPWADRLVESVFTADELRARVAGHLDRNPPELAPAVPPVTRDQAPEVTPEEDIPQADILFPDQPDES